MRCGCRGVLAVFLAVFLLLPITFGLSLNSNDLTGSMI